MFFSVQAEVTRLKRPMANGTLAHGVSSSVHGSGHGALTRSEIKSHIA